MFRQPFEVSAPFVSNFPLFEGRTPGLSMLLNQPSLGTPYEVSAPFLTSALPDQLNVQSVSTPSEVAAPFLRVLVPVKPGSLLNITAGVPSSCMPAPGTRCWGGALVTEKTLSRAEAIIILGAPTASQDLSIHRGFLQWRFRQGLTGYPLGQTLAVFGAYLEEADLKHSTICEYVQSAHKMCRRDGEACSDEILYKNFLKGAQLLAANDKPDHAIDVSFERILAILQKLDRAKHDEWRFSIWMMVTCGARMSDLRRLKTAMISFSNGILKILFRVTKTSRDGSETYEVTVEQIAGLAFEQQWRIFLAQEKPFRLKADSVNKVLHHFGFPETTYSFRRYFIQATIARFTENGHTEWCRVIEITGHQQGKTVRAKYALHVDDPLPGEVIALKVKGKRDRSGLTTVSSVLQEKENSKVVGVSFQSKLERFWPKK